MCLKNLFILILVIYSQSLLSQSHWRPQAINVLPDSQRVSSISIVDETTVWGVAFFDKTPAPVPPEVIPKVILTTDSGVNWIIHDIMEAQGKITQDVFAFDDSIAWVTTNGLTFGSQVLLKTTDAGATWEEKYNNTSAGGLIHFFDEDEGILIHGKFMSTTIDGGETWAELSIYDLPFEGDEDIFYRAGNNALATQGDTLWFGTTFGRVFKSTDRGQTWVAYETPLEDNDVIVSTAFRNDQEGIIISYSKLVGLAIEFQEDTQISITSDGGETWELTDTIFDFKINCITVIPDTSITFMSATNGLCSFSKDTTLSWEHISFRPYNAIEFFTSELGWVGSGQTSSSHPAAMYKWQGVITNFENLEVEKIDVKIFPNPFEENIQFEISKTDFQTHQNENLTLYVFDIFGKKLFSQSITQLKHNLQFSNIAKGTYFYSLQSDKGTLNTGKIIKID